MLKLIRPSARAIPNRRCIPLVWRNPVPIAGSSQPNSTARWDEGSKRLFRSTPIIGQQTAARINTADAAENAPPLNSISPTPKEKLPLVCPGCGAHSHTIDPDTAGYYGSRRAAKASHRSAARREEDEIFQQVLKSGALPNDISIPQDTHEATSPIQEVPICDRCHYLLYQSKGTSIIHPSMQSIRDIIEESPHKHNHIYHILDAADFPMSLIPNLQHALKLPRLRTQNRRSKSIRYIRGRVAEVSFIITRSDLLAPKKEQVDSLVPYLREVLRDALGRSARNVRLGNVRCVSAKRGWWTKVVKEDIWERGGAGWMVGKVNVGKSALYEVVFPKGRNLVDADVRRMRNQERQGLEKDVALLKGGETTVDGRDDGMQVLTPFVDSPGELSEPVEVRTAENDSFQEAELETNGLVFEDTEEDVIFDGHDDATSLLPPAQPETAYPRMPLVSPLPGTTASPIRIPFGNGKGELIDLPGIQRSSLSTYIQPEHHNELVMKSRIVPEQLTIKPGQSLLLGGMIRITPKTDTLIFLAHPLVPLKAHVTSTEKAIAIQTGVHSTGEAYTGTVENIATEATKQTIRSAGTFQLEWDVTKRRAGPLTAKAAGNQRAANLPFVVYSADLLIESVGWIELVCQVRNRRESFFSETVIDALGQETIRKPVVPGVEVWSPEGKFVDVRRPMNAWLLGGPNKVAKHARRGRGRQSISMAKRRAGGAAGGRSVVAAMEE